MARSTKHKSTQLTKKHLDRIHREKLQTRWILICSTVVLVLVIGVIVYGILDQKVLMGMRPVATVNEDKISVNDFRSTTMYHRYELIQNAVRLYEFLQLFGSSADSMSSLENQFVSVANELEVFRAGNQALDQMINTLLIIQEAKRRGITVSEEEIEIGMQEWMGYYANGTPIPTPTQEIMPTSTLSPMQLTMMPRTATPTPTLSLDALATPTITLTSTAITTLTATAILTPTESLISTSTEILTPTVTPFPTSTPTPYTFEGYQQLYSTAMANFWDNYQIPEKTLRYVIETRLYYKKILPLIVGEVVCTQDQVWAEHILVEDETLAKDIHQQLKEGEEWDLMALTYSTDTSNNFKGGDLGWFPHGKMVQEFDDAAFSLEVGEISQPVKTEFGWHIIRVLGHEERSLDASECEQTKNEKFTEWLDKLRESSEIEINDIWQRVVPIQPTLPPEIQTIVDSLKPQIPVEFSTPAP